MSNILLKYLSERIEKEKDQSQNEPGPVVTISRQYGCYGNEIAKLLETHLNVISKEKNDQYQWKSIAKEIIEDAARHLDVDQSQIAHIFAANERTVLEDMAIAFSIKKYARDPQIKKLISRVVQQYAEQGHVIIVGRAGCVLAKHIPKSLHIRLIATDEWRINSVENHLNISEKEAIKKINEIDEKRKTFMKFYKGDKPDSELFDVILNRAKLNNSEIVCAIITLMKSRNLIE